MGIFFREAGNLESTSDASLIELGSSYLLIPSLFKNEKPLREPIISSKKEVRNFLISRHERKDFPGSKKWICLHVYHVAGMPAAWIFAVLDLQQDSEKQRV